MKETESEKIKDYYREREAFFTSELQRLLKRKSSFAWLRLGSIAALFFAFYLLWQAGVIYVMIAVAILLFIFIRLVYADLRNHQEIHFTKTLISLYQKEKESLDGSFPFEPGSEFADKDHPYTSDLDIFGSNSLYQFLNRTTSEPGSKKLADYLQAPAPIDLIYRRQTAVAELKNNERWIKEMQAAGKLHAFTFKAKQRLQNWIAEPTLFLQFKPWKWLRYLLPLIILSIVALFIFDVVNLSVLLLALLLFAIIAWQINKVVAPIHNDLSNVADELGSLSAVLSMIEKKDFKSELLQGLKQEITADETASGSIRRLKKLLDKLDLRYNLVLSAPLNILLQWNLQQLLDLEKWKTKHQNTLEKWIRTLAEFEALNSLAVIHFNHPDWTFPKITEDYFHIEGQDLGHPLIPPQKRIDNPVSIPNKGEIMLVTGSNMAGKSTYLRCVGVNCVLAFCGAPVCGSAYTVSHVSLISSMRVADNLQESTSTFYAELKKLKTIIDKVNAGERVFILLDEILRGTNSFDRHTGSRALIKQLIDKKAAAILATHDLELAEMKESFSEKILNYHFDVQVSNEELFFDYKLKPGICRSMNASILMKKIGIEM